MTITVTGALAAECNRLREENRRLREAVAEMERSPEYWHGRALKAEASLTEARAERDRLRDELRVAMGEFDRKCKELNAARAETGALIERAAHVGYVACAETRHVTLGGIVAERILALSPDATAALAEVRRAAKAEGMKEAADLPRYDPDYTDGYGDRSKMVREEYGDWINRDAILVRATEIEKGATS